jgi:uncharacterized protein
MEDIWLYLFLSLAAFSAGFIDAVVGGGGLIQVPALFILFPQLSHTNIIASNRLASIAGTIVAARQYLKQTTVNKLYVAVAGVCIAIASYCGVYLMHKIPTTTFKQILFFVIILLTIYTIFKKNMGAEQKPFIPNKKLLISFAFIGIALGLYNGTIGPGTGTLLVFAFIQIVGFNFLQANAYTKVCNAIADGASLIAFFIQGAIVYKIALLMLVFNVLGSYIGSKAAIKNGNGFIRLIFIFVMCLLLVRLGWEIWLK